MGGDQHGQALVGEVVDLVPEVAPRLGVDAGGGFVEQQQPGLVQGGRGQREALLPAARKAAGQLVAAVGEPQPLQRRIHPLAPPVEAVDAGGEFQVLGDGQVLVEREPLGHVAGLALDLFGLANDVEAQARP